MSTWNPVRWSARSDRAIDNAREACRELAGLREEREEIAALVTEILEARAPAAVAVEG